MTPTITLVEAKATDQRYQGTADVLTTVRSGVAECGRGSGGWCSGGCSHGRSEVCDDAYLQIYRPKSEVAKRLFGPAGNKPRAPPSR